MLRLVPAAGGSALTVPLDKLAGAGVTLGRQSDCDLVVSNSTVSKRHARLTLGPGNALSVEDMGSGRATATAMGWLPLESQL